MFLGDTQSEHSEGTALREGGQKQKGNQELTDNKTALSGNHKLSVWDLCQKKINGINRTAKGRALTGSVGLYRQQQRQQEHDYPV